MPLQTADSGIACTAASQDAQWRKLARLVASRLDGLKAIAACLTLQRSSGRASRPASGDDLAPGERVRERAAIHVFELAADGHAVGDS